MMDMMNTMDTDLILEALDRALEDHRTVKGIGAASGVPENSITQFRTKEKHPLGKTNREKLTKWLEKQGYIESDSDPIEDSIGFLRKALEFAEKRNEPRGKRAAVLIELLALVERHFAAELREIGNGKDLT